MLTFAAWAVFGIWFGATVVAQLPAGRSLVTGRLIPGWAFFGPRPPTTDVHLLYRDLIDADTSTDWCEVPLVRSASATSWLWQPRRRIYKAVEQAGQVLDGADADVHDPAYRLLARLVWRHDHTTSAADPTDVRRQFMLASATYEGEARTLRVAFVSQAHPEGAL